jgi:hypothetical protein
MQPQTCSISPALLLPTPGGTPFSVNAADTPGDYLFNMHATGLDPLTVTHDFALTVHVIDFTLSAPSPASVSPGNTAAPVSLLVSALGAFNASVTLLCSGLPAGASCQFQPSAPGVPSSANPAAITLNINTLSSTPLGTYQVTITASTPGEASKSQTLTLVVSAAADFSIDISNAALVGSVNVPAVFNGTLIAANSYSSSVTLACGPGAPPSCVIHPATITPTSLGAPFTATVSSSVSQAYSFNVTDVGNDPSAITKSTPVTFTALSNQNFDFTIGITPPNASIPAGQPAVFNIDVNPTTGSFPSNVTVSCSKLPALTTCTFNPARSAPEVETQSSH